MSNRFKLQPSRNLLTEAEKDFTLNHQLLTRATHNPKTAKYLDKLELESAVLHLAPAWNSGYLTCSNASPGCALACLFRAGRAGSFPLINESRIRKTRLFIEYHEEFMALLVKEIQNLVKRAEKRHRQPTLRLNATSDIPWEEVPVTIDGVEYPNLMTAFPGIIFYDYTKVIRRLRKPLPANYSLTFSLSESNDVHAQEALSLGFNVAAVLRVRKGVDFPETFAGHKIVDGDEHDYRFLDPKGSIIGLRPKGPAINDTSGFVRDLSSHIATCGKVTFHLRPVA